LEQSRTRSGKMVAVLQRRHAAIQGLRVPQTILGRGSNAVDFVTEESRARRGSLPATSLARVRFASLSCFFAALKVEVFLRRDAG